MEYRQYIVKAFERKPGKWRASVQRCDGRPLMVTGRVKWCAPPELDSFMRRF